ncbi:MAG: undecaprenyldiphospho-muramoylpentapeptide beta-N-acetylglucosaminyltransferase [Actinomycetia bacterium]|nr:undecaprenyldiphospho-muramoylpentapeptide beta-N-acetylglucosaminyltransferase [Actinomycetes bacterium]
MSTTATPDLPPLRVLLAGGGTAGHVEPSLALADALLRRLPDVVVTALGTESGLETRLVPAHGIDVRLIPKVTMPRGGPRRWAGVPTAVWSAVRAASAVIERDRPDVVVGFGGFVALPAYLAARRAGVPFVVHEANARPGVANRIGARFTRYVAVSTPSTVNSLPHAVLVGIPLRSSISSLDRPSVRSKARLTFGLDVERPTILVFGGSQGARTINAAMQGAARGLLDAGIQILHAAGPNNTVVVDRRDADPPYVVLPYLERMDLAYAAADVVLSRSGAMTCAELAAVGLPAVFVPYPHSNGEQSVNAQPLVDVGAGLMVRDEDLTASVVEDLVGGLVLDPERLAVMSKAAESLGARDADERLTDLVLRAAGRA